MAAESRSERSAGRCPARLRTMIDAMVWGPGLTTCVIAYWASIAMCVQLGADGEAVADEVRKWSDKGGTVTKEGSLEQVEGNWVHLKLTDGQVIRLPLAWLSDADQAYVRKQGDVTPTVNAAKPEVATEERPPAQPVSDYKGDLVTVTVEGIGVDKKSAEEDAWRAAIRQVVGGYVDSETIVENDQLIRDKVITLSSAYVERATTKRTRREDGLFYVTVEAAVRVTKVLETLQQHSVAIAKIEPDAVRDVAAREQTQEEQEQARKDLLARALRNYPENCMKVSIDGKPEIATTTVTFRIKVEPDMEAFAAVADKVVEALTSTTRRNGVRRSSAEAFGDADGRRQDLKNLILHGIHSSFPNSHQILADAAKGEPRTTCLAPPVMSSMVETEHGLKSLAFANGQATWGKDTYLCLPYRANKLLSRITWRWFVIDKDEFEEMLKPRMHHIEVYSELLDGQGDQVADDITIMRYGWSGYTKDASPEFTGRVVIGPFTCYGTYGEDCYVPYFSFVRTITLAPEEIQAIRAVKCSVQAGSPIWRENTDNK